MSPKGTLQTIKVGIGNTILSPGSVMIYIIDLMAPETPSITNIQALGILNHYESF